MDTCVKSALSLASGFDVCQIVGCTVACGYVRQVKKSKVTEYFIFPSALSLGIVLLYSITIDCSRGNASNFSKASFQLSCK